MVQTAWSSQEPNQIEDSFGGFNGTDSVVISGS